VGLHGRAIPAPTPAHGEPRTGRGARTPGGANGSVGAVPVSPGGVFEGPATAGSARLRTVSARPAPSPGKAAPARATGAGGEGEPLEGRKSKGGSGATRRFAAERNGLPRRTKPGRRARDRRERRYRSSRRQAGRPDREVQRPCRGRGTLRRTESQERHRSETCPDGRGRNKASGGCETLETQQDPGEVTPGEVASRNLERCRERNPGEASVRFGGQALPIGHTPKRSRSSRRVRGIPH